jgi:hypothetical protein
MTQAPIAVAAEKAALAVIAMVYRGSSELGQRYYIASCQHSFTYYLPA